MEDPRIIQVISQCKKFFSSFSCSSKKRREPAEVLTQLGLPGHKLITETDTSWASRLLMLERVLEQGRALYKVLFSDTNRRLVPTWKDIEVLEEVQKALKPLQDFTDALSGEEYATLSIVRPALHLFNTSLLAPAEGDSELCQSIKRSIVDYLNNEFADPSTSDLLDIASFVDPRFKKKYTLREKADALKRKVFSEVESLLNSQNRRLSEPPTPAAPESAAQNEAAGAHTAKKRRTLGSFFQNTTATISTQEVIKQELFSYHVVCVENDADPLKWWKEHEVAYPALSLLAKKYLCVPATSSTGRLFSGTGNGVACHRASLKPDTVDTLVFLAQNV